MLCASRIMSKEKFSMVTFTEQGGLKSILWFFVLNASKNTLGIDKIKFCNMEDHKMSFMNLKRL